MVLIVPPMYLLSQAEQPGLSFSISALWLTDHRGIVEKFKRLQDSKSQLIFRRANQKEFNRTMSPKEPGAIEAFVFPLVVVSRVFKYCLISMPEMIGYADTYSTTW